MKLFVQTDDFRRLNVGFALDEGKLNTATHLQLTAAAFSFYLTSLLFWRFCS